jgi:hypothetical protein
MFARRENNMAGRKEEDPISFATSTEMETTGAFNVRVGFGSDSETEYKSEWVAYIGGWVKEGDTAEELRASESGEDRLAGCDLDTGDLRIRENPLAVHGRLLGVLAGESRASCPPKGKGDRLPFQPQRSEQGQCSPT